MPDLHYCNQLRNATLEHALRTLAADASLARSLGSAGRQRVERHFSIDNMVRAYSSVYERAGVR
jgi:glycosyltransferase involved in cell wall biosynthesis